MFGIAAFAILSHVCVLPHAHAAVLHPHAWDGVIAAEESKSHADEPEHDDAIHNASCTALRTAFSSPAPLAAGAAVLPAILEPLERVMVVAALTPTWSPPPLFLLHASLLI